MATKGLLLMPSSSCKLLWGLSDHVACQGLQVLRVCKAFQVFEENQGKQVYRVHQDLKVKEDFREFQEKTEIPVKMAGPVRLAHLALWVKEDFLVCLDFQGSKATGASQASMGLKESKVFKEKKGRQDHQEGQGHRDLLAQLDPEESEAEMDLRDQQEYEEWTVCQGHKDHRDLWGTPDHRGYQGLQA